MTQWTRQTPTYWVATIEGYQVAVKKWWHAASWPNGRWHYLVTFRPDATADTPWSCGYPETLKEAKAAAEQMARAWAGMAGK